MLSEGVEACVGEKRVFKILHILGDVLHLSLSGMGRAFYIDEHALFRLKSALAYRAAHYLKHISAAYIGVIPCFGRRAVAVELYSGGDCGVFLFRSVHSAVVVVGKCCLGFKVRYLNGAVHVHALGQNINSAVFAVYVHVDVTRSDVKVVFSRKRVENVESHWVAHTCRVVVSVRSYAEQRPLFAFSRIFDKLSLCCKVNIIRVFRVKRTCRLV